MFTPSMSLWCRFALVICLCTGSSFPSFARTQYESEPLDKWPSSFRAKNTSLEVVEEDTDKGIYKYKSESFVFDLPGAIRKRSAMREVVEVFEATFGALMAMPLPWQEALQDTPLEVKVYATHEDFVAAGGFTFGVARYLKESNKIIVSPYMVGLKIDRNNITFAGSVESPTVITEVSLAVLARWDIPYWLRHGVSQYMSQVPYRNGGFNFRNADPKTILDWYQTRFEKSGILKIDILFARQKWEMKPAEAYSGPSRFTGLVLACYFLNHGDEEAKMRLRDYLLATIEGSGDWASRNKILSEHSSGDTLEDRLKKMVRDFYRIDVQFNDYQ